MTSYKRTINKFNRGEVDHRFSARDDVDRVVDTSLQMRNFMPIRLGPMQYRPGTEFLGAVQVAANAVLIPVLAPNDQSALVELTQSTANPSVETLRVWQAGALVQCVATANTITNGTFNTDIAGWTDGSDVGGTAVWGTGGYAVLTGNGTAAHGRLSQTLTVTAAAERTLVITIEDGEVSTLIGYTGVDSSEVFSGTLAKGVHALTITPTGTALTVTFRNSAAYPVKVDGLAYAAAGPLAISGSFLPDTSTTGDVLDTLQYVQSADVVYVTSDGYRLEQQAWPVVRVERRGAKSWSISIPEAQEGPFGPVNDTAVTLAPSAVSGEITLTASLPLFSDSTRWVGRSYKLVHGANEGVAIITSVTSATVATARVTVAFGGTAATADWYPGLFSRWQAGPTAVSIYDGRMWLAGDGRVWGSVSDAYTVFDESLVGDSKAISRSIGFGPVQQVNWLSAGPQLVLGTPTAEIRVASNDFGDVITATNCRLPNVSSIGSSRIPPERIDGLVYMVQRSGRRVIELSSLSQEGGAEFRDLMQLHPDVCSAGIVAIALARHPEPRLYCVLADGSLAVCLLEAAERITGWTPIELEGATVERIAVLPDTDEDEVYVIVSRSGVRYLERFAPFALARGAAISRHYDGHVYAASPGSTISGLGHLATQSVYVWADGREFGPYTVSGSSISVGTNTWTHTVTGRKHTATWESNRLGQYLPSSVMTDRKRVTHVGLILADVALGTVRVGDQEIPLVDRQQQTEPSSTPTVVGSVDSSGMGAFSEATAMAIGGGYAYLIMPMGFFDAGSAALISQSAIQSNLPTTFKAIAINDAAKTIYVSGLNGANSSIYRFSYTNIDDLSTGVTYLGVINIEAIVPSISDVSDILEVLDDGAMAIFQTSSTLYQVAMSVPWDFTTISLVATRTRAQIDATVNMDISAATTVGLAVSGGEAWMRVRVASNSRFYFARGPFSVVSGIGSFTLLESFSGSWLPSGAVDLGTGGEIGGTGTTSNAASGKTYMFANPSIGVYTVNQYDGAVLDGTLTISPTINERARGIAFAESGSRMVVLSSDKRFTSWGG